MRIGLGTDLYRRNLLSVDSVDVIPSMSLKYIKKCKSIQFSVGVVGFFFRAATL